MTEGSQPPAERSSAAQDPARAVRLTDGIERDVSYQYYGLQAQIDGVWLRTLRKHRGENGWFLELFRIGESGEALATPSEVILRQLSASYAEPHRLNAFHIHPREPQNEVWSVVAGLLTVWLVDCRHGSPTEGEKQKVVLSGEEPGQLYIPAGVAHGYRAGPEGALLLYAMDAQFDPDLPNEGRLPWDHFGADLWAEDRG